MLVWFTVLAVAFQFVLVQGHVHIGAHAPAIAAAALTDVADIGADNSGDAGKPGKAPADDPAQCFICQQAALAGVAVLPASPTALIVEASVFVGPKENEAPAIARAPSHSWQSRGPPALI